LQGFLLQVDVTEIVVHEADDPDTFVDLLDVDALTGEDGRDVDSLAVHADAAAGGDQHFALVQGVARERCAPAPQHIRTNFVCSALEMASIRRHLRSHRH
jgi:hypothetical protein